MEKLTIEEIYCLKRFGMPTSEILKTDLEAFDRLYDKHPEFDAWLEKGEEIFDRQQELGIITISCQDESFPTELKRIGNDCPPLIYCLGNIALLKRKGKVAIIGARKADKPGLAKAADLAKRFVNEGNIIVSGLAHGCDAAAHLGCLDADGATIAIVGSGLDIIFPAENANLQERILDAGGLVMSEQEIGIQASGQNLVARNRLQAALSDKVILAQCPEKSGSMHTMRFARRYKKQCYAASFPKYTEASSGNKLLLDNNQAREI